MSISPTNSFLPMRSGLLSKDQQHDQPNKPSYPWDISKQTHSSLPKSHHFFLSLASRFARALPFLQPFSASKSNAVRRYAVAGCLFVVTKYRNVFPGICR
ncbi:hypothetical protein VTJ04DRAFT_1811 [Mycothermus thermophilus]|uniref:uncharacterized protein n=1 Tax=Humicola insolens TaxID=85995 RepID=UPI0037434F04